MQFFPQQQLFGGFIPQAQQCSSCPAYNNYFRQQQYPPLSAFYPQPQQFYYPQQFYPPLQQPQFFYPQQQWLNWPQFNAYGSQRYWPQQQQRVFDDPPKHRKKNEPKKSYERYYY